MKLRILKVRILFKKSKFQSNNNKRSHKKTPHYIVHYLKLSQNLLQQKRLVVCLRQLKDCKVKCAKLIIKSLAKFSKISCTSI